MQSLGVAWISQGTSTNSTFGSATTAGNAIGITPFYFNAGITISSVTDAQGDYFALLATTMTASVHWDLWISTNIHGGATTVTVKTSAGAFITFTGFEASTLQGILDGFVYKVGAVGTTPTCGTFSTTNPTDFVLTSFSSGGITPGAITAEPSGYTLIGKHESSGTDEDGHTDYQITSSALTNVTPTWAGSSLNLWAAGCGGLK